MAEVKLDPTLRLRPSGDVLEFVDFLCPASSPADEVPQCIMALRSQGHLTPDGLMWLYKKRERLSDFCQSTGRAEKIRFHQLMWSCQMILPEPEFPPRNPILEARVQKLKAQQAEREYKQMTMNVDGRVGLRKHGLDDPITLQMKELNNYLFIVLQFVISLVVGFASGYFGPYFFAGVTDTGSRIIYGILAAFIFAVADLYFIIKFLLETEGFIKDGSMSFFDPSAKKKA